MVLQHYIPSHNTETTRGPHQTLRLLHSILDSNAWGAVKAAQEGAEMALNMGKGKGVGVII